MVRKSSLSRLQHLVGFLDAIYSRRIDLYLHQQGIDTTTRAGKALFQMCGVVQERVKAGIARAGAGGKVWAGRGCLAEVEDTRTARERQRHHQHRAGAAVGGGTVQRVLKSSAQQWHA